MLREVAAYRDGFFGWPADNARLRRQRIINTDHGAAGITRQQTHIRSCVSRITEDKSAAADSIRWPAGRLRRVELVVGIAIRRRDDAGAGGHGRRVGIPETALAKKIIPTLGLNIAIGRPGGSEVWLLKFQRRLSFRLTVG